MEEEDGEKRSEDRRGRKGRIEGYAQGNIGREREREGGMIYTHTLQQD